MPLKTPAPETTPASPTPSPVPAAASPSTDADPAAQAASLFKDRRYQEAIPYFRSVLKNDPHNAKAYYGLGTSLLRTGDQRGGVAALAIAAQVRRDKKLGDYVRASLAHLPHLDAQWVEDQVSAFTQGQVPSFLGFSDYPRLGLRAQGQFAIVGLSPFKADLQAQAFYAGQQQSIDPAYRFTGKAPDNALGFGIQAFYKFDPHLELDAPFALLPVGKVSGTVQSPVFGNSSMSYDLHAFMGGLDGKVLAGNTPLQFFVSGGPRLAWVGVGVDYSNATATGSSDFGAWVLGSQAQVGLEWEFAEHLLLSPTIGYRWLRADKVTGNLSVGGQNVLSRLEMDPNASNGPLITTVPESQDDPSGMSPLSVDLSGIVAGLEITAAF